MTIKTSLCAVPYEVTEQDGQVIFEERSGFAGTHCRFTLEWMGCGWYLVEFDDWAGRVFAPHIAAALEWVEANYAKEWKDGTATVKLNAGSTPLTPSPLMSASGPDAHPHPVVPHGHDGTRGRRPTPD